MTTIGAILLTAVAIVTNDWENPKINSINRLPARTYTVPLLMEKDAFTNAIEISSPYVMTLNGNWRFRWVGNPSLAIQNFWAVDFDDSKWDFIDVPSCVEMRCYGAPIYTNVLYPHSDTSNPSNPDFAKILDRFTKRHDFNPVSSYRRKFTIPQNWAGRKTILRFEGVGSAFYVWVNGNLVGYAEDSKLASEFDITKFISETSENTIAVRVYKWSDGSFLEDQDMFRYSGIFRDVSLWSCPKDGIWDFDVKTQLSSDYKNGYISVEGIEGKWEGSLYDAKGTKVAQFASDSASAMKEVKNVALWSAEKPNLYTLILKKGGDIRTKKIGFKEQKIVGEVFYINGLAIKLRGVNRHETNPDNGRTVTLEDMIKDIELMKRYNIDTVRTSHYPNHRLWYELCDRYGIYVVAEANVEGHEPGYGNKGLGRFREWDHTIVERNARHVKSFKNTVSITMWSLGNETGHGDGFRKAYAAVRNLDPISRPIHWEQGNKDADVDSSMYPSIAWLQERLTIFDEKPTDKPQKRIHPSLERAQHSPGKPYFMCEYAHAMGNAIGNLQEYWDIVYSRDGMLGGCIWDWIDQAIWKYTDEIDEKTGLRKRYLAFGGDFDDQPNLGPFCCNGIIGPLRNVTDKLIEVAHVYRSIFIEKDSTNNLYLINRYGFTSPAEFDCTWQCLVDGVVVKKGTFALPDVKPLQKAPLGFDVDVQLGLDKSVYEKSEVILNFITKTRKATPWAKKGWVVARNEIKLSDRVKKTFVADGDQEVVISEENNSVTVGCGRTTAIFSRKTGTISRLVMRGVQVFADPSKGVAAGPLLTCFRALVDNDKYMRNPDARMAKENFYHSGLSQLKYHPEPIEVISNGVKIVTLVQGSKSAGFIHEARWTFSKDGSIDIENNVKPFGTMPNSIPRLGLSMRLPRTLERMRYYGRGPWENYIDRCTGSFLGIWNSTVKDQYVDYVRPQDNGYKSDVRWAEFLDRSGAGVRFEADVPLFMQALHCTDQDLEWARHWSGEIRRNNPVEFKKDIFLKLDVRQTGLGGASCGPRPISKYLFNPNDNVSWTMRISPVARPVKK